MTMMRTTRTMKMELPRKKAKESQAKTLLLHLENPASQEPKVPRSTFQMTMIPMKAMTDLTNLIYSGINDDILFVETLNLVSRFEKFNNFSTFSDRMNTAWVEE